MSNLDSVSSPSRTPSDILPTLAELMHVVTEGPGVRWWLVHVDGTLESEDAQRTARPDDAQEPDTYIGSDGEVYQDWYTPWYSDGAHLHNADRGPLAWSIHAYGTLESVRRLQVAMLWRCGR
jgi:hypothetical protein